MYIYFIVYIYIYMICAQAVQLFVTRWTVDCQAPLSMGFLKQEYWSGLPFPSPGDLLSLLHWQVDSLLLASPRKPHVCVCVYTMKYYSALKRKETNTCYNTVNLEDTMLSDISQAHCLTPSI